MAADSKNIYLVGITHASDFLSTVFDKGNSYSLSIAESV